jgi:F0F1-type ATP synthase membrane subunit b/b'
MDSIEKLTTAIAMVEEARGVPLSASCVLHRGEILEVLDGARAALPNDLEAARKIIASRDSLIEEGRTSAEALIASAREEVSRMIEQTAIVSAAREEAQHILDDAHIESDAEREEVEKYIDSRLATLEVILNKTSDAVARGRERLAGAGDKDVLSQLANDK